MEMEHMKVTWAVLGNTNESDQLSLCKCFLQICLPDYFSFDVQNHLWATIGKLQYRCHNLYLKEEKTKKWYQVSFSS